MSSTYFFHTRTFEKSAAEAFKAARQESRLASRKYAFVMLDPIDGMDALESSFEYRWDHRINESGKPAGCIHNDEGFSFFGWARDDNDDS